MMSRHPKAHLRYHGGTPEAVSIGEAGRVTRKIAGVERVLRGRAQKAVSEALLHPALAA